MPMVTDVAARSLAGPHSLFTLVGSARLWVVIYYVDRAVAEGILPPFVELGEAPHAPPGTHPVFYSFGLQKVGLHWLRSVTHTYSEAVIGVCRTRLRAKTGAQQPYSVMSSVATNSPLATVLGWLVGYPKVWRRAAALEREFRINTLLSGRSLMAGQFETPGLPAPPGTPPSVELAEILRHPVVSRAPWGTLLASRFEIETALKFGPVAGSAQVTGNELVGLAAGLHKWVPLGARPDGAILSSHGWFADLPSRLR